MDQPRWPESRRLGAASPPTWRRCSGVIDRRLPPVPTGARQCRPTGSAGAVSNMTPLLAAELFPGLITMKHTNRADCAEDHVHPRRPAHG